MRRWALSRAALTGEQRAGRRSDQDEANIADANEAHNASRKDGVAMSMRSRFMPVTKSRPVDLR